MSILKTRLAGTVALLGAVSALAGCSGLDKRVANDLTTTSAAVEQYNATQRDVRAARPSDVRTAPEAKPVNVRYRDEVYGAQVGVRARNGQPLPVQWEGAKGISIKSSGPMSLPEVAAEFTRMTGIPVAGATRYAHTKNADLPGFDKGVLEQGGFISQQSAVSGLLTWDYEGPASGFWNDASAKYGISWEFRNGAVRLFENETRTFVVAVPPLDNKVESSIGGSTAESQNQSGTSSADVGSGKVSFESKIKLDYWKQLEKDIKSVLPTDVPYSVSPESGTVTVTGPSQILERVEKLIDQQNEVMTRQVAISVQVLSVDLSDQEAFSFDPSVFFSAAGINFALSSASTMAGVGVGTFTGTVENAITSGFDQPFNKDYPEGGGNIQTRIKNPNARRFAGSSAAVDALRRNTNASIVTSASVTTMNNQPAPIQVANQLAYVGGYKSNTSGGSGDVITQEPIAKTVTTGFSMSVLPRILENGRVAMQYSANLSDLANLATFGADTKAPIQLPEVNTRSFLQSVMMRSGETLVLGGFQQVEGKSTRNNEGVTASVLNVNKDDSHHRKVIVILLTPTVLETPAPLAVSAR